MSLLDVLILLIASVILFFAHTPLAWTVIITLGVLAVVRILRGERVP